MTESRRLPIADEGPRELGARGKKRLSPPLPAMAIRLIALTSQGLTV
ncbi:MAG TPA: hypothetical protein VL984_11770 [Acidimicrobiales bacterium]|nr:hypothetical protein [Acidimicrobiales bacterium]